MRIVSHRRDYYFFVGRRYGEDPRVVYFADKVKEPPCLGKGTHFGWHEDWQMDQDKLPGSCRERFTKGKTVRFVKLSYVVVGDFVFPVIYDDVEARQMASDSFRRPGPLLRSKKVLDKEEHGSLVTELPAAPAMTDTHVLIKAVGAPVFMVTAWQGMLFVDMKVPLLADYGIPALLKPEQAWQSVYSVLTNVLRESPDKMPPRQVSNQERIWAAGFDEKTSIRGRQP